MRRMLSGLRAGALLIAWVANAAPITFDFTGVVTQVPIDDQGTGIQPLDAMFGIFTFDSTAADAIAAADAGSYTSSGAGFGISSSIGASLVTLSEAGLLNIGVLNSFVDQYTVHGSSTGLVLDLLFQDSSATVFSSDALPLSPPVLASFGQREFHFDSTDVVGNETQIDGIISTLTCGAGCDQSAPAPEPSSGVLFLAAAVFSCGWLLVSRQISTNWRTKVTISITRMRWMGLLAIVALPALPTYAVDGVVLINQASALAGNVTPGDTPGFPVTLSVPGSYKLSGNLTVPDANTVAIEITGDDVTLDLNGFSVIGPTICILLTDTTSCSPLGSGVGISGGRFNTRILNGNVRGTGGHGISLLGDHPSVERIHSTSNGGVGILLSPVSKDGRVIGCTTSTNALEGIRVDGEAISSAASFNGGDGIIIDGSAINNVVFGNRRNGISGSGVISGNSTTSNRASGIIANGAAVGNRAASNAGGDIVVSGTRANNSPAP